MITGLGYSSAKTEYDYQIALVTYLKDDANEDKGDSLQDAGVIFYYNEEVLEI